MSIETSTIISLWEVTNTYEDFRQNVWSNLIINKTKNGSLLKISQTPDTKKPRKLRG